MRYFLIALLLIGHVAEAQPVPKTVVAEHFTNTYCSVCASRNPGFYANLSGLGQVLHVAYHPSAPYPACPLNMHNVAENNARTNYYSVYGATPRVVIQGVPLSSGANYADPAIFSPVLGQTTPFSMRVEVTPQGADSVTTRVVIKKEDASSLTDLLLYAVLVEDTVFFTAANGEPNSKDVFRKAVWGATPLSITAPVAVGDSVTYTATSAINSVWVRQRMYAIAMLQEADKAMVQAAKSGHLPAAAGMGQMGGNGSLSLYPNPPRTALYIKGILEWPCDVRLYDIGGRLVKSVTLPHALAFVDVSGIPEGIYVLKGQNAGAEFALPFRKER